MHFGLEGNHFSEFDFPFAGFFVCVCVFVSLELSLMLYCSLWRILFQPESITFTEKLTVSGMPHQHLYTSKEQGSPCFKFPCLCQYQAELQFYFKQDAYIFFFSVVLWKKSIHIQLPQGGEMEKKIVERCKWTTWGSRREVKPVIRLNFTKVTELADTTVCAALKKQAYF